MIQVEKMQKFYLANYDFQIFVNKNIQTYGRTLDQELRNPITQEYYLTLQKRGCNAKSEDRTEDN